MGRSVQVDNSIQRYAESCVQSRAAAQVGTLVGRSSPGKDLLLQALRTPNSDGVAPLSVTAGSTAKKGGKGGKPSSSAGGGLLLDEELVVEHATIVERLLPGGLDVMGFYVLCPATAFAGTTALLSALVGQAARELSGRLPTMLVLHIDSISGALSLREVAAGGSLRPCEFKLAGLLDQMVQLQCRYEIRLQVPVTRGKQELHAVLQSAADSAVDQVHGALGLVSGQLATDDCQVADLADDGSGSGGGGPIPVDLLLQPSSSLVFCTAGGGKAGSGLQHGSAEGPTLGLILLAACLDCRACVHRREAATAAVNAIRADLKRSLQARMDALLDAAEQQQEASAAEAEQRQQGGNSSSSEAAAAFPPVHPLLSAVAHCSKPLVVSLPRRAFVAAVPPARGVSFCDYLFEGESTQALLARLQMLLLMPGLATAAVECLEQAAVRPRPGARGPQAVGISGSGGTGRADALPCTMLIAVSAAMAVLTLALGYMALGPGR